jgi:CheY-like chemotaxis protein
VSSARVLKGCRWRRGNVAVVRRPRAFALSNGGVSDVDVQCSRASASESDPDRLFGRVLVIDDDARNANVIANLLAGAGYGVERAFDGIAGARLAEQIQPDVVLVNLALPMHSGLDVLDRLNQLHPTREISITIDRTYALVLLRNEVGSGDCFPEKPFDFKELMRRVRELVAGAPPSDQLLQPTAQ